MKTKHSIKHIAELSGVVALLLLPALVAGQGKFRLYNNLNGSATLTAVGNEPNASGTATLSCQVTGTPAGQSGSGHLSVSCQGLTPNASYVVNVARLQHPDGIATVHGDLKILSSFAFGSKSGGGIPSYISVYRVESSGNALVLSGTITWQY